MKIFVKKLKAFKLLLISFFIVFLSIITVLPVIAETRNLHIINTKNKLEAREQMIDKYTASRSSKCQNEENELNVLIYNINDNAEVIQNDFAIVSQKIQNTINTLSSKNYNTAKVQSYFNSFLQTLELADQNIFSALELMNIKQNYICNLNEDIAIDDINSHLKEAKINFKEANKIYSESIVFELSKLLNNEI